MLIEVSTEMNLKTAAVMWPVRIAISGQAVTPGGAIEILEILGKKESILRIEHALDLLESIQ